MAAAPAPATSEALLDRLGTMLAAGNAPLHLEASADGKTPAETWGFDDPRYHLLRRFLPEAMAWHENFPSPYGDAEEEALHKAQKEKGDSWIHDVGARLPVDALIERWIAAFGDPLAWLHALPADAFPKDKPLVRETPFGRVALGTPGDDVYTGDYAVLIDPGGNDRYTGCRIGAAYGTQGRGAGFFADLGGNDVYDCADVDLSLGAATLGVAAFFDLGAGDDRYRGGHGSLGAAAGGVAVFYDDGGSDTYDGRTYTEGAAGFGVGVFQDDAVQAPPVMTADEGTKEPVRIGAFDNDQVRAWANAQGFARCRGVALCLNTRGNDVYQAGGVYLDAPLFADRYQSFSQGFAIGERGVDYAGGIALIADFAGNDRYLGDIYDQGVGYWYSAGLLYDGSGNDLYEMTQYGQGSGIHLAVGGLVDVAGSDTYVMHSGLGQGGSHDFAGSILQDRGGNDHYLGMTSCDGCGLTNSVGLFLDRSGDDTYAGRRGSLNFGRPARGFASVGVMVDLGGKDDYLGIMKDDTAWRHSDLGVGLDEASEAKSQQSGPGALPTKGAPGAAVKIPAVCSYEGKLTQEVFDELWALAIRWEVGENRRIVPQARARLVKFGAPVLPYLDRAMDQGASGLELRAYKDVLAGLRKGGAEEPVLDFLRRNLKAPTERRRKVALWLAGELKARATEAEVVALLKGTDASLARRAAGVLGLIGSRAGDDVLRGWLGKPDEELRVMAALGVLLGADVPCYDDVRPLLDHPLVSVRTRLATLLAGHVATYGNQVEIDVMLGSLPLRARRTALDALARAKQPPSPATVAALLGLLDAEDWGLRADVARVLHVHGQDPALPDDLRADVAAALAKRLETEKEPYVRFWLQPR
jgi:HEAT repeat protein